MYETSCEAPDHTTISRSTHTLCILQVTILWLGHNNIPPDVLAQTGPRHSLTPIHPTCIVCTLNRSHGHIMITLAIEPQFSFAKQVFGKNICRVFSDVSSRPAEQGRAGACAACGPTQSDLCCLWPAGLACDYQVCIHTTQHQQQLCKLLYSQNIISMIRVCFILHDDDSSDSECIQ